jgi:hypothetical protein
MAAVASNVPITVVAHMYGRQYGYNDKVNQLIKIYMDFYHIDHVI